MKPSPDTCASKDGEWLLFANALSLSLPLFVLLFSFFKLLHCHFCELVCRPVQCSQYFRDNKQEKERVWMFGIHTSIQTRELQEALEGRQAGRQALIIDSIASGGVVVRWWRSCSWCFLQALYPHQHFFSNPFIPKKPLLLFLFFFLRFSYFFLDVVCVCVCVNLFRCREWLVAFKRQKVVKKK